MENKILVTEAAQTNHETTKDARLKWTRPHLSPLGVADETNGKGALNVVEITDFSGPS
jgi:hypothetical protein